MKKISTEYPKDIEFHAQLRPRNGRPADAISLTGYKWSIYLRVERGGCCPQSTERLEIPISGSDFDALIKMLRGAKKAARPVSRYLAKKGGK